ncbi:MAG: hypothetical protein ACW98X_09580 [Promethearchaeota archaeon]
MDERKEEDTEQEFDENGFDPTKEAFFSDLIEMEEEVATEAYELVEHAIQLVETKYFDDGIEVLRQAIGLYSQINRADEIKAINEKISEVYLLKEQAFRESEIESEIEVAEAKEPYNSDGIKRSKEEKYDIEVDLLIQAEQLIKAGNKLVEANKFEETLDVYDKAVEIFEEANNPEGVERVFKLIEVCYNKKAEFLQSVKKVSTPVEIEKGQELIQAPDEEPKDEKLQQYLISKKKEEVLSSEAYDKLGQAAELAKSKQFDESLLLYKEGVKLFEELGWTYEVKKVQDTIAQLENEKEVLLKRLEKQKVRKEETPQTQINNVELLGQEVKEREEQEKLEKLERLRGIEIQRMENDFFKAQIDNMATEASRMAREYELAMQKAIKKGELVEECIYPQVIEIYEKIKDLLIDKGWSSESSIYDDTIKVYHQKLEQDKKIRQIEAQKVEKQKEAEEYLKVKKEVKTPVHKDSQLQIPEEQRREAVETQQLKAEIDEITNRAEKETREYELALRKGKFELVCPYPDIINILRNTMQKAQERGWETEVAILLSHIQLYREKLEKDKRLRQIETEKVQKQKDIEEVSKIQQEKQMSELELAKIGKTEVERIEEDTEEDFEQLINDMDNKAEIMAREYDLAMKKAVRQGKLTDNPPFAEIIKIFERAKQMLLAKNRQEDAAVFNTKINVYSQKLEKDNKLREIEAQKAQKHKDIEEMHKIGKESLREEEKLRALELKKGEEEEFEQNITENINRAEKLVRDYETALRKAMRKAEILEDTPYSEVIDIYKDLREKVYARGWKEQTEVYANQIRIYQEKLDKHVKLLDIEAKKAERQKDIEDMHKVGKVVEVDLKKLKKLSKKKGEEEFQEYISKLVDKAAKLERDYDSALKKAIKKGEIIDDTPYPKIIEIYEQIKKDLNEKGWIEQAQIYSNQIKIYEGKLEKSEKLRQVEAKKRERQKEIEEMHKVQEDFQPTKPDKIKKTEKGVKEEDILLDTAMNLIDEAEKLVKNYELSIKTDVLLYDSPYDTAISNYQEAKNTFQKIGWNDEASRLINTIKFYKEKKEKDEKLRQIEKKKLEKPVTELEFAKDGTEKDLLAREKKILEIEKFKKEKDEAAEFILNDIHKAERIAKDYEIKLKDGIFDQDPPYDEILKIYREARKKFEEIGWIEESMKLINTIKFYKEKQEKDNKLRALEIAKVKKRDDELLRQQRQLKQAKEEQERLLKQRKESLLLKEEKVIKFESAKDKAFSLMDKAKNELTMNNFEKAIEYYKGSEEIFSEISWQEGIHMVKDSIAMIKRRQKSFELEQATLEREKTEKLKIEEKLEEKFTKAEELRQLQQEEKRKEFLRVQNEKQWERETSEEAFKILEQGTSLLDRKKFTEAYEMYIEARNLFNKISWKREVSRINNELLFKLKRERQQYKALEAIKKKKAEEDKQMEKLKRETEKQRKELKKQKKEDKRKLAKEEFDKKIFKELERAQMFIDDFHYNEGILLLKREEKKLNKSENDEEIKKIEEIISDLEDKTEIPLVTLEPLSKIESLERFEAAYKALDRAQVSINNNRVMKAISEFNEAKFNLNILKIGKKYINEIDAKIQELQGKLGKKPGKDDFKSKEKEQEAEMDMLKARIAARREERRKKVLNLLKKE